ncbi:sensor histidine kinase [Hufsiella ginkgonis]|uniref:histidine kinase n=1 Tax=Hufsiella ginkgonis TaxID=2695274 RepID=A0A7K1XV17_9SPHI|nr:HAMP domain-containing sensor histidine kinase [Hufsiella ginkgonis]MXV14647.1 sensor histidine kinase [Hufsiella ginkgonis]
MKLHTKLTLFNTLSKLVIVVLFVMLIPLLTRKINQSFIDNRLLKQKDKVMQVIDSLGIRYYMPDDSSYGSYTMLKEEYIALDRYSSPVQLDTIANERRMVERDTIEYRILSHTFKAGNKDYLLEIGKSVSTIGETSSPLQSIALQVLLGMVLLTIVADFSYANYILQPLDRIIRAKLLGKRFPLVGTYPRIKTSTYDFKYLDESIHEMISHIEQAFQKEREFISNASHELMTPVSILQNKIENLFDREDITDDVQMQLIAMQKTLNRLKSIAQTLLLISQIENDQFIREDTIQVEEILKEVYEEIAIRMQDKNLGFTLDVPPDTKLVNVNRFLLFNLFFNLVNNAIKYNVPNGAIRITGSMVHGKFQLAFTDTGKGIPAEQIPLIFDRFKKFRQSSPQESFGLGLPIVKSIAGFHNILIKVESETGKGTTFTLTFPSELLPA